VHEKRCQEVIAGNVYFGGRLVSRCLAASEIRLPCYTDRRPRSYSTKLSMMEDRQPASQPAGSPAGNFTFHYPIKTGDLEARAKQLDSDIVRCMLVAAASPDLSLCLCRFLDLAFSAVL